MAVRNCAEIGENCHKIMRRLLADDDLVKLLYYSDVDPWSQPNLTEEEKQEFVFNKLIKITPRVGPKETAQSIISIIVMNGVQNRDNSEFRDIKISINVFVPLTQWFMKSSNLRPFAIMGEVQKSLNGKTINGLGKMTGGDFNLAFVSDENSCYSQDFMITTYE